MRGAGSLLSLRGERQSMFPLDRRKSVERDRRLKMEHGREDQNGSRRGWKCGLSPLELFGMFWVPGSVHGHPFGTHHLTELVGQRK